VFHKGAISIPEWGVELDAQEWSGTWCDRCGYQPGAVPERMP